MGSGGPRKREFCQQMPSASVLPRGSSLLACPADFGLAGLHIHKSQFLKTNSSLNVYIHPSGSDCPENPGNTLAHTGDLPSHMMAYLQGGNQMGHSPNDHTGHPRSKSSEPCRHHSKCISLRLPGAPLQGQWLWRESFVQYLLTSSVRLWKEGAEASTPSPSGAKGKDACSEAGRTRSTWAAAGEMLRTQRRIIPSGTQLINGPFIRPPYPTHPPHIWNGLFKDPASLNSTPNSLGLPLRHSGGPPSPGSSPQARL